MSDEFATLNACYGHLSILEVYRRLECLDAANKLIAEAADEAKRLTDELTEAREREARQRAEVQFAVFVMRGRQYVRITNWHSSYEEAEQAAELHSYPVGHMGVRVGERTYLNVEGSS
jgi:hypothetical protein